MQNFNPRAYVRHDSGRTWFSASWSNFNPRAYVRHDHLGSTPCAGFSGFQSTCLREARRKPRRRAHRGADFNPRAYVRHDSILYIRGQISYLPQRCIIAIIFNKKHKQSRTTLQNTNTALHTADCLHHARYTSEIREKTLHIGKQSIFAGSRTSPGKHGHFTFATRSEKYHYRIRTSSTFSPGLAPTCST